MTEDLWFLVGAIIAAVICMVVSPEMRLIAWHSFRWPLTTTYYEVPEKRRKKREPTA